MNKSVRGAGRLKKVLILSLAFIFFGTSSSLADQTINLDLSNFVGDGLVDDSPNFTVYGVSDGDVITLNVSNSAEGFLGYINDGVGNRLSVSGTNLSVLNNEGQFYGPGVVSSAVYEGSITGSYTVQLTIGANGRFDNAIFEEAAIASSTTNPQDSYGWLVLDWRQYMVNEENWKYVSIIGSGRVTSSEYLVSAKAPTITHSDSAVTCDTGNYKYASGSVAPIASYMYTLHLNGKAVSRLVSDPSNQFNRSTLGSVNQEISGEIISGKGTWNLKGSSNYGISCEVTVLTSGLSMTSSTETIYDSAYYAAIKAKADAQEAARQAALVEFNSKENRELRKRLAARGIRG